MAVHVDSTLPIHPLTVADVDAMVRAGILGEDDRVELLDGVLVEMSPMGDAHAHAVRRLNMLAVPAAAAQGLEVSPQCPLNVRTPISQPEPDMAIIPITPSDERPGNALLVVEIGVTSLALDLGRKAAVYAAATIPEYWVLDIENRRLIVHRDPAGDRYRDVRSLGEHETATAQALDLSVPVRALL